MKANIVHDSTAHVEPPFKHPLPNQIDKRLKWPFKIYLL